MKKSLQEVQKESLQWYCEYLDTLEKEISNEYELLTYCSFAGRLASLGKGEYVVKADSLLSNQLFTQSVDDMFTDRIRQIFFELKDLSGKELGVAISELQDLYCFFKYTTFSFSNDLHDFLDKAVNYSVYSDISLKTIKFLHKFRKIYPIPKKDAIPTVLRPHPRILHDIEAASMPYKSVVYNPAYINKEWTIETDRYTLHLKVTDNSPNAKTFESYLTFNDKNYLASDMVFSQGRVFAIQSKENPLCWTLNYNLFPSLDLEKQIDLPLTITMPLGGKAEILHPFSTRDYAVSLIDQFIDIPSPTYNNEIPQHDDLKPGANLKGTVLKVFEFGVFIDIGLPFCGFAHLSELSDKYIRDPHEVVAQGDVVNVWVVNVDKERHRVSLTLLDPSRQRTSVSQQGVLGDMQRNIPNEVREILLRFMQKQNNSGVDIDKPSLLQFYLGESEKTALQNMVNLSDQFRNNVDKFLSPNNPLDSLMDFKPGTQDFSNLDQNELIKMIISKLEGKEQEVNNL